jgi:hypothetical protein
MLKHQAMQPPVSRAGREKRLWPNRQERRRVPIDALMAVRKYRDSPYKTVICGDLHSHACVDVSVLCTASSIYALCDIHPIPLMHLRD